MIMNFISLNLSRSSGSDGRTTLSVTRMEQDNGNKITLSLVLFLL